MNIELRRLALDDVENLSQLYDELNDYLAANVNYPGWRKGIYPTYKDALGDAEAGTGYVAVIDGELAGAVTLNDDAEPDPIDGSWLLDAGPDEVRAIHRMCVRPKFHRAGVGEALLRYAEAVAREQGMKSLRLDVYEHNTVAMRLYEKCGYERIGTVDLGLGELHGLKWFKLYELPLVVV